MSAKNGKPCRRCGANEWSARGDCLPCNRANSRKWRAANKNKVIENNKKYYADNKESVKVSSREYYYANSERVREVHKRRYLANRDIILEKVKKYVDTHRENYRKYTRKWEKANPESRRARDNARRARKAGNGGRFTASEFIALCEYYENSCLACGRDDIPLTADHVIPLSLGGCSDITNIQPLCRSCNTRKYIKSTDYRRKK